jgi:hypothetical protein
LQDAIDKAEAWIESRPDIFSWPEPVPSCCRVMGDANGSGAVNILDITFVISYLYKGGPAPTCYAEADINCDCVVNILDVTTIILYLYYLHDPCDCDTWNANCGK